MIIEKRTWHGWFVVVPVFLALTACAADNHGPGLNDPAVHASNSIDSSAVPVPPHRPDVGAAALRHIFDDVSRHGSLSSSTCPFGSQCSGIFIGGECLERSEWAYRRLIKLVPALAEYKNNEMKDVQFEAIIQAAANPDQVYALIVYQLETGVSALFEYDVEKIKTTLNNVSGIASKLDDILACEKSEYCSYENVEGYERARRHAGIVLGRLNYYVWQLNKGSQYLKASAFHFAQVSKARDLLKFKDAPLRARIGYHWGEEVNLLTIRALLSLENGTELKLDISREELLQHYIQLRNRLSDDTAYLVGEGYSYIHLTEDYSDFANVALVLAVMYQREDHQAITQILEDLEYVAAPLRDGCFLASDLFYLSRWAAVLSLKESTSNLKNTLAAANTAERISELAQVIGSDWYVERASSIREELLRVSKGRQSKPSNSFFVR